jgi:uncharacterized protein (TIGR03437 family)
LSTTGVSSVRQDLYNLFLLYVKNMYGNVRAPLRMFRRFVGALIVVLGAASQWAQAQTLLNFEGLTDGVAVTTQFAGITFSNAQVLTAGFSLDQLEYPPHSGANVITDSGGPITITFTSAISAFSGFFTHSNPITIDAFDIGNQIVATSSSKNNAGISGTSTPNELLSLNGTNIVKVVITGNPAGNSVVADDLSYTNAGPVVPGVTSVVNAASLVAGAVASGSLATIAGTNLATDTVWATGVPLPTSLGGDTATVGGIPAAFYLVSPGQVDIQIPVGLPAGPAKLVFNANGASTTVTIQIAATAPGLFLNGTYAEAINLSSGTVNGPTAGAAPSSSVAVFLTGTGAANPSVATGGAALASPASSIVASVTATIGGLAATVSLAELDPGEVGVTQVNVQVPAGLANGAHPLIVTVGGVPSNSGLLMVTAP